jgi:uncharacterized phiE125 gp8 family phage protein
MRTLLVTDSTGSPFTLEEIKNHLRIELGETGEDDFLKGLRTASIETAENITSRKLMSEKWKVYFDDWSDGDSMELPYSPLSNVASTGITYTGSTGNTTTLGSTAWSVDTVSEPGRIVLENSESWPTDTLHQNNPIEIEFTCGYSASSEVPRSIKHACFLMIGHWYENREDTIIGAGQVVHEIPAGSKALLESYRTKWF